LNKTILITGAAKRLGKDIALSLSEFGHDIILHYNRSTKSEIEELSHKLAKNGSIVFPVKADVSDVAEIKKMFKVIGREFNNLEVLINNAAIFEHYDFFDITEKIFDKFINTNLKSGFFCAQEAAKIMMNSKIEQGKIINMASLGGILNWTGYMPYGISKAGVIKMTYLLAKKLAPKILVNAIAPGTIWIDGDKNDNVNPVETKKYPMKKLGKAKDITSLINFLVNENKYITGQVIAVDGGRSIIS
jgi:NAD(P)-dependent dehydrogenase (short-subunit alcohol dehydrogenase family)